MSSNNIEFEKLFKNALKKDFPDKIIVGYNIQTDTMKRITKYCNLNNLDKIEEIRKLGYQIYRSGTILEKEIPTKLENYYPDKVTRKKSDLNDRDNKLYRRIKELSKQKNLDFDQYIKSCKWQY